MKDLFSEVGKMEYVIKKYGMDADSIVSAAEKVLLRK